MNATVSSTAFCVALLEHRNGNYPQVATLWALLAQQADMAHIPASHRDLSSSLGGTVPPRTVLNALTKLEADGWVESKTHPNTTTRYRVNVDALRMLTSSVFGMFHFGAMFNGYTLRQNETPKQPEFFVGLLHRLDSDYSLSAILYALLAMGADVDFVKTTGRGLSARLDGRVSETTAFRALGKLESLGLLERRIESVSKKNVSYRVDVEALRALLARPLVPATVIPGLTPLRALERIFAPLNPV